MTIRLQQMHPALVRLPLTMLPPSRPTRPARSARSGDSQTLRDFVQKAICLAALVALGAAASGLVAGEEVNAEARLRATT